MYFVAATATSTKGPEILRKITEPPTTSRRYKGDMKFHMEKNQSQNRARDFQEVEVPFTPKEIVVRRITTFRSTTNRIYNGGPIIIIIIIMPVPMTARSKAQI
jgi:hypothetical protein